MYERPSTEFVSHRFRAALLLVIYGLGCAGRRRIKKSLSVLLLTAETTTAALAETLVNFINSAVRCHTKCSAELTLLFLLSMGTAATHAATNLTTLFSFQNLVNGYDPRPSLVFCSNQFFYGTTSGGGSNDLGTIFRTDLQGNVNLFVVFNGTNGAEPYGGLLLANDGNLYGTTMEGGLSNHGTLFRLTPEGDFTSLPLFAGTNGHWPSTPLIQGTDGYLYGTTSSGGAYNSGTVFRMSLAGNLTTVFSFARTNGMDPSSLLQASDGSFYGVTRIGGDIDGGTAFQLTTDGKLKTLVSFDFTNGYWPVGGLLQASDGNLYGTTCGMLSGGGATVFRLTTEGALSTLVSFNNTNGGSPLATLMQASDGCIYGTTTYGGPVGLGGPGTIFRLGLDGSFTTVYAFHGTEGAHPRSTLLQLPDGNFYGVTSDGGSYSSGTIFKLSLPLAPALRQPVLANGTLTLSWSTVAGQFYQLEYSSDPTASTWNPLGPAALADSGEMSSMDPLAPGQSRFYRIGVLP